MIKVIKGGEVYTPEPIGKKDILITDGKIYKILDKINVKEFPFEVEVIDARNKKVVPGFIDSHVHIAGGGGEGGFKTRTPAIGLSDLTTAGITTVIGCRGTDGVTRSGEDLLARARGLNQEGVTSYIYTGSYQLPVKTITDGVQNDLILIDLVIGVGEIAISDHRSSQPDIQDLKKAAAEARVGGILSGKAGVINIHIGDGDNEIEFIEKITSNSEIPVSQFLPTHMNRNIKLLQRALDYAQKGGLVDFTTSTTDKLLANGETKCSRALKHFLEEGVPVDNISFSSDGQGSLPNFDQKGNYMGLKVGQVSSLFKEVKDSVLEEGLKLSTALKVITVNPAQNLNLEAKGRICSKADADLVLLNEDTLEIETVLARGQVMVREGDVVVSGTFE